MPTVERPSMSEYGVPEHLDGALPWSWAEERLVDCRNYWVVTASTDARPHAMPVWGVWLASREEFWFSCAPGSRKARNLAVNGSCSVAVDDTVECVVVEGIARVAGPADLSGTAEMIEAYLDKYWEDESVHAEMDAFLRRNAIFVVRPERAFGIIEREEEFSSRATRWRW
jgi:hypothetical protein